MLYLDIGILNLPMAEAIESSKKYSDFNGSIITEGIELAERHGLSCKIVHSSLDELKKNNRFRYTSNCNPSRNS